MGFKSSSGIKKGQVNNEKYIIICKEVEWHDFQSNEYKTVNGTDL